MRTKLKKYGFVDTQCHRLENCQDYLDIVDVLRKAKELKQAMNRDYFGLEEYIKGYGETKKKFEQALAKITIEDETTNEDKDTINYQLEKAGLSEKERILILSIIDLVYRNREEFKKTKEKQ